jgi:hypothetical protein
MMPQVAYLLVLALAAGLLEAFLVVVTPASGSSDLAWAMAAGYCLALAGTLAAHLAGMPRQAWVRRAHCGAVAGMLAQVFASAWTVAWSGTRDLATPTWLLVAAPLLGALGALLGSLLEGMGTDTPARLNGRRMEENA